MNRNDRIKQAYVYGASIALTEAGFEKDAADQLAVQMLMQKLAEGEEGPSLGTRIGVSASGPFAPITAGLTAPEGQGWKTYGATTGKGMLGGMAGGAIGTAAGLGGAALLNAISKGKAGKLTSEIASEISKDLPVTADGLTKLIRLGKGGIGGGMLGTVAGGIYGTQKGLTTGYER